MDSTIVFVSGLSMVLAGVLIILAPLASSFFKRRALKVAKGKLCGGMFVHNSHNKIYAVCSYNEFNFSRALCYAGNKEPWKKISIKVVPTFTFANSTHIERMVTTGTMHDLESVLKQHITKMTGLNTSHYSRKDLEPLYNTLSIQDPRLYVPYSNDKDAEADYRTFGSVGLHEFQKLLRT